MLAPSTGAMLGSLATPGKLSSRASCSNSRLSEPEIEFIRLLTEMVQYNVSTQAFRNMSKKQLGRDKGESGGKKGEVRI